MWWVGVLGWGRLGGLCAWVGLAGIVCCLVILSGVSEDCRLHLLMVFMMGRYVHATVGVA